MIECRPLFFQDCQKPPAPCREKHAQREHSRGGEGNRQVRQAIEVRYLCGDTS